ncbi:MAG: Uma2 family endonuclease [Aquificaceae bacterium]|uniref:Uma2 family endonuclease n=1 Tax=Hydrogenobacter sp. Uz 6-8 TaxID=3384828 RepID=UPI0030B3F1E8
MRLKHIPHYTYEDYAKWQGDWELVEGIPYAMASPSRLHQRVVFRLQRLLAEELEKNSCGCEVVSDVDWIVSEDTVIRPDIAVLCEEGDEYITEIPLLIVEVVSKTSRIHDEKVKFNLYEELGVPYYLLVYPEQKNWKAYRNTGEGFVLVESPLFVIGNCELELDFNTVWR